MFLPFGTVFLTQMIRAVPGEVMEAARLAGAGTGRILIHMIAPMVKSGLVCLTVLTFVDA